MNIISFRKSNSSNTFIVLDLIYQKSLLCFDGFNSEVHSDAPSIHHQARFITRTAPAAGQDNIDPLIGTVIGYSETGAPIVAKDPGAMVELAPVENITFSAPPDRR